MLMLFNIAGFRSRGPLNQFGLQDGTVSSEAWQWMFGPLSQGASVVNCPEDVPCDSGRNVGSQPSEEVIPSRNQADSILFFVIHSLLNIYFLSQ